VWLEVHVIRLEEEYSFAFFLAQIGYDPAVLRESLLAVGEALFSQSLLLHG